MSNPTELVRVKDPATGAEKTMTRARAARTGMTVLDKPTHDRYGRAIPTKTNPLRRTPAATKPAATKTAAAKKAVAKPAAAPVAENKES